MCVTCLAKIKIFVINPDKSNILLALVPILACIIQTGLVDIFSVLDF